MDTLSKKQIEEELEQLDGWSFEDDTITKDFSFPDFKEAISFMVRVGFEAEALVHHPDWSNVYNSVSITLSTHDAGGKVTEKDIKLAKAIEEVYQ
ncbi:4a-hydroxytetrahydrobiopterin dehydratase [Rhodohalobacter sulfatireducens]|uniref:Putative pterin-4-alpha-carbinolamine dehydratase n=1 Tax=Rhodohalobacter sulfatireducens TaxID=2911366 RepID=A0ABS9KBR6_9BACT|nr:4a-hydroxytetrahydrobiopterin dehydratase [Rhodohalobacter sulfatireducens]MCG2588299.1 4a-hydroxytetrahydrobiopterin dehydratase [Rhodohalobacter sulfatireducens]